VAQWEVCEEYKGGQGFKKCAGLVKVLNRSEQSGIGSSGLALRGFG